MKYLAMILVALGLAAGSAAVFDREDTHSGIAYVTAPAEKAQIARRVTATGRVRALVTVDVSAQVSGQITELFADFNQTVEPGQRLARVDERRFRAQLAEMRAAVDAAKSRVRIEEARVSGAKSSLASERARGIIIAAQADRAKTSLASADRDFKRLETLSGNGSIAQRQADVAKTEREVAAIDLRQAEGEALVHRETIAQAEADLKRAEAELQNAEAGLSQVLASLEIAEIELTQTEILSPIDGIVIDRTVEVGQAVSPSVDAAPLFRIARNLAEMEVHARIDEADIGLIRVGQAAEFQVDAFRGRRFEGSVIQVRPSPKIANGVVTYTVVLAAPNPDLLLLPGMTALVSVVVQTSAEDALTVANAALRFRPSDPELAAESPAGEGNAVVWIRDGARLPRPVRVTTGLRDVMRTEVLDGEIAEGQQLVVGTEAPPEPRRLFGLRLGF